MIDPRAPDIKEDEGDTSLGPQPRSTVSALARALEFPERAVVELLTTVNEAAVGSLARSGEFEAQGFGRWQLHSFRPRTPMALKTCYGWDPTEVPHPGPVSFEPAAALLRQLDDGALDTRAMFTCTALLQTLIQRTGVPQAQAGQVMHLFFVTVTDLLLVEGFSMIPSFGTLRISRRPTVLKVDPDSGTVLPLLRNSVRFRPSPKLVEALPSSYRLLAWDTQREPHLEYSEMLAEDPEGQLPKVKRP